MSMVRQSDINLHPAFYIPGLLGSGTAMGIMFSLGPSAVHPAIGIPVIVILLIHILFVLPGILAAWSENKYFRIPFVKYVPKQERLKNKMNKALALEDELNRILNDIPEDNVHRDSLKTRLGELQRYQQQKQVEMVYGKLSDLDKRVSRVVKK